MRVSDEPLINQARERFALQDYYGAVHLLQGIVDSGRSSRIATTSWGCATPCWASRRKRWSTSAAPWS